MELRRWFGDGLACCSTDTIASFSKTLVKSMRNYKIDDPPAAPDTLQDTPEKKRNRANVRIDAPSGGSLMSALSDANTNTNANTNTLSVGQDAGTIAQSRSATVGTQLPTGSESSG